LVRKVLRAGVLKRFDETAVHFLIKLCGTRRHIEVNSRDAFGAGATNERQGNLFRFPSSGKPDQNRCWTMMFAEGCP